MTTKREHRTPPRAAQAVVAGVEASATARQNRLLRALSAEEQKRLLPHLEPISVTLMQELAEAGHRPDHVFFPETAVLSMLRCLRDGTRIDAGTVGCEGMAGLDAFGGLDWTPMPIVARVPGSCQRIAVATLQALLPELPTLTTLLDRYTLAFMDQLGQTLACNSLHSIEQRCARWLLTAHDCVGSDEFHLTHETLAQMLAVRRAGVTVAAISFQRAGLLTYSRGRVTILDRAGLERVACECHEVAGARMERFLDLPSAG
jgi:CRP-like cAMP-binding protein